MFKPIQNSNPTDNLTEVRSQNVSRSSKTELSCDSNSSDCDRNRSADCNSSYEYKRHTPRQDKDLCYHEKSSRPCSRQSTILLRRSSSALRVREVRDALSEMTSQPTSPTSCVEPGKDGVVEGVLGSQNARLLVASQQRLVSRLQDLRNELAGMDNEVTRVRNDIMCSRRYFSAMTGIPCELVWPLNRQMDSAYTSPTSFISTSSGGSPYSSDTDSSPVTMDSTKSNTDSLFQSLRNFDELTEQSRGGQLSRSDSCSSFASWRSDVELAGVFPDEADPATAETYKRQSARRQQQNVTVS